MYACIDGERRLAVEKTRKKDKAYRAYTKTAQNIVREVYKQTETII